MTPREKAEPKTIAKIKKHMDDGAKFTKAVSDAEALLKAAEENLRSAGGNWKNGEGCDMCKTLATNHYDSALTGLELSDFNSHCSGYAKCADERRQLPTLPATLEKVAESDNDDWKHHVKHCDFETFAPIRQVWSIVLVIVLVLLLVVGITLLCLWQHGILCKRSEEEE